ALTVGDEVDLGRPGAEQQCRIDVGVARPGPEMERLAARRPHDLALADGVAAPNTCRREERVAGADAVGMQDDDVERAADLAGEDDLAACRGLDLGAGCSRIVEPTVARPV